MIPSLYNTGASQALFFFHYIPNLPLAIVSLCIYALFTLYLTFRIFQSKSANYLYILAFTALMETVGYAVRIACHYFTDLGRYIGMTLFLLLAPNALALVNYKTVGEIIRLSGIQSNRFYLKHTFVTWFFFASDVFAFALQGAGGGMQTSTDLYQTGRVITLIGLALQLVFFACYGCITIYVHRSPQEYHVAHQPNAKRRLIFCLYVTIILLYIRSIYRVAEYASGYDGVIATTEWAFYVFDTLVIAASFAVYSVFFIGQYLPKRDQTIESRSDVEKE
ncbi:RTA1 like protein-domain-containing protein [Choanephora cucurbitarum]|nr:RTA1 like protein-domain-containing protein [Choanephora cucurbitarum]